MNLDNVSSIFYNNKEVISIKNLLNDEYIYQKDSTPIELIFTGQELHQYSTAKAFEGNNILIDYGDGTIVPYEQDYSHTYAQTDTYTIQIYGVTTIKREAFSSCDGLISVNIPDTVRNIEYACFLLSTSLTTVSFPNTVTNIGASCFNGCSALTSVTLPNKLTSLGIGFFYECASLETISIPNTVTSLGDRCFKYCTTLTEITIPTSVTDILGTCFEGCTSLTNIEIPYTVTSIGYSCFRNCTGLIKIVLNWESSSEILTYDATWINGCTSFENFIIPEGTTDLYVDKGYPIELLKENMLFDSISLNIDKNILSSIDGDSTSLSAQLMYNGEYSVSEGRTVYFNIIDSDGIVEWIGNGTTNNNGVATCDTDYTAQGLGDVTIQASVVKDSDTYTDTKTIEDCIYYNPNVISSATTVNISLPSAPFEIKYSVSVASNGGGTGFLRFNDASGFYTGKGASSNKNINLNSQVLEQIPSLQTYYEYTMTYQNGVATLSRGGNTVSENVASLTSLYLINSNYNTYVKGIKIKPLYSIDISATTDVLSYADSDTTTLTATLSPVASGKTVKIYQDDVLVATEQTDSSGQVSYTYTSQGIGDVEFKFKSGNIEETYSISDCMYWNSGASVGSLIYDTGTTCTSNGEYISFGTSTSGEKHCKIPVTVENGSNWELEYTVAKLGTAQTSAFAVMYGTNDYVLCRPRDGKISVDGTKIGNNGYSRDFQANDVINWKYLNGTLTVTLNGTVTLYNGVTAISDITALRWYTNQNRMQHFKNIKVKPLYSIDVSATADILSYADSPTPTTTLTATINPVQSGRTVKIYQDDNLVDTEQTDSNGQVSYTYTSQGIGDVEFKFVSGSIEETYSIQDGIKADTMLNSIKSWWSSTGFSISSGNNGTTLAYGSGGVNKLLTSVNLDEYIVEYDFVSGGGNNDGMGIFRVENSSNDYTMYTGYYRTRYRIGANVGSEISISQSAPSNAHFKIEVKPTEHKIYKDDVLLATVNPSNSTTSANIGYYLSNSTSSFKIKNFIIKPLQSIDVSATADVLSYADSPTPTSTLTATVNPIESGKTVKIYQDDVLVATEQTDSNGQVSYTYTSQGIGDVEFKFKSGSLVSEIYELEDCRKYDGASSDKTSNYSNTRVMYDTNTNANYSLSFDSSNSCYKSSITDGNKGSYFLIPLTTLDSDMEISFETYGDGTNICDSGFGVFNSSNNHSNLVYTRVHSPNDTTLVKRLTKTTSLTSWVHVYHQPESNNQYQKWIKHIISIDGLDFVYTTKDSSDNTIWTYTGSFDSEMSNKQIGLVIGWYKSITSWKNLKIKPL